MLGPAAVWLAVSADAVFAAVAAWGICCLAMAATAPGIPSDWRCGPSCPGLLLGYAVMMSYGLPLMGLLAVAVLLVARRWEPLLIAGGAALAVVVAFAVAGFSWWEAYPVLRERYLVGIASVRPASYWLWGDLAALAFSAGPVVGAADRNHCEAVSICVGAQRLGQPLATRRPYPTWSCSRWWCGRGDGRDCRCLSHEQRRS